MKIKPGRYTVKRVNARETKDARDGGLITTGESLSAPDAGGWLLRLTAAARAGR